MSWNGGRGRGGRGFGGPPPLSWAELNTLRSLAQSQQFSSLAQMAEMLMQARPGSMQLSQAMMLAQMFSGQGGQFNAAGGPQMAMLLASGLLGPGSSGPIASGVPPSAAPTVVASPAAHIDVAALAQQVAAHLAASAPGLIPAANLPAAPTAAIPAPAVAAAVPPGPPPVPPVGAAQNQQVLDPAALPPYAANGGNYAGLDQAVRQAVRNVITAATSMGALGGLLHDSQRISATHLQEVYEAVCDPQSPDHAPWSSRANAVVPLAVILWRHRQAFAQA